MALTDFLRNYDFYGKDDTHPIAGYYADQSKLKTDQDYNILAKHLDNVLYPVFVDGFGQILPEVQVAGDRLNPYNTGEQYEVRDSKDTPRTNPYSEEQLLSNPQNRMQRIVSVARDELSKIYRHPEYAQSLKRELGYSDEEAQNFIHKLIENMNVPLKDNAETRQYFNDNPSVYAFYRNKSTAIEPRKGVLGYLDKQLFSFLGDKFISLGTEKNNNIANSDNISIPELQALISHATHELGHASEHDRTDDQRRTIEAHNNQYPVQLDPGYKLDPEFGQYLLSPTELRTRALKLRWWHQKTGRSYKDLLEDRNVMNSENDMKQLRYYNQDQLLKYLQHFVYNEPEKTDNQVYQAKQGRKLIPHKRYIK